jgi:putative ABC transport system permease protein
VLQPPEQFYRRLLILLPRPFRREAEAELIETFHEARMRARARGAAALILFWVRAVLDVFVTAIVERNWGQRLPFDVRMAVRSLGRTPGFTGAAVITFALGIGINLAVLSVVDRMTFRPLPYGEAERLVYLRGASARSQPSPTSFLSAVVPPAVVSGAPGFEDVALAHGSQTPVTLDDGSTLAVVTASRNLLHVLRVGVSAGRDFAADDEATDYRHRTLLLSHAAWVGRFGRSQDVFARPLTAGRVIYRVVGVLPQGFLVPSSSFTGRIDGVILETASTRPPDPTNLGPAAIGRLRAGVGLPQAQAEVDVVMQQLLQAHPASILTRLPSVRVQPLQTGLFEFYRPYAWVVLAGVAGVLLVGCVNLATLFLARGRSREQVAAIQSALGATRSQVMRTAILEAVAVCLLGAGLAIAVCYAAFETILTIVPAALVSAAVTPLDPRLIGFTVIAALLTAVIAGSLPALRAARRDVVAGLRRDDRSTAGRLRGGSTLLVIQAALGVVLVTGAAVTVRSFVAMLFEDPGYRADDLYDLSVQHGYARDQPRNTVSRIRRAEETVRGFAGIEGAGVGSRFLTGFTLLDDAFWTDRGQSGARIGIGGGLFKAMGTAMLAGREFTDQEVHDAAPVAIVNRTAAAQLWPGTVPQEVIGQTLTTTDGVRTLVGVAQDVRRLPAVPMVATLFIPVTAPEAPFSSSSLAMTVRMMPGHSLDAAGLDARLDESLGQNTLRVEAVASRSRPQLQQPRFQAILFASVAVIGLLLAVTGLYAVAAFDVARRRFEVGVRLTLGATRTGVHALFLKGAVRPVIAGVLLGIAMAWWLARFLQAFVFEVDARDPWTLLLVAVVLLMTAVLAAWLPARRAARTDPATVLRAL